MQKFLTGMLLILVCGCQSTEYYGIWRPEETPFGEEVNRPFNDMINSAWRADDIIGEVYFEYDKDDLTDITKDQLQAFAYEINQRDGQVIIAGHADHNNTDLYNLRLGYQRALQVADYLRSAGVWGERIVIRSHGETRPAATNWTDSTRALNRRVVVAMFDQGEGMSGEEAIRVLNQKEESKAASEAPASPLENLLGGGLGAGGAE